MATSKPAAAVTPTDIFFFVPNLIGYARITLSLISFAAAANYPMVFLVCYTLSFVLDAADGMAARALNQCSHFGAILDMLTDRASSAAVLIVISHAVQPAPEWVMVVFAALVFLDVASHFCRMYMSLFIGKQSHKDVSDSIFWLLSVYYTNRKVMGAFCVGQEFAYILYYANHFYGPKASSDGSSAGFGVGHVIQYSLAVTMVLCALKHVVNVQQLLDGLYHISVMDATERAEAAKKAKAKTP